MEQLIIIPTQPSSGTSALAGVLYKLGVDMGSVRAKKQEHKRGYKMYEDDDVGKFGEHLDIPRNRVGKILAYGFHMRKYVYYRLDKPGGIKGSKIPAVWCIADSDIGSLPIVTMDVTRPLEVSLEADMETWRRKNPGKYDGNAGLLETHRVLRSTDLASCYVAKDVLFGYHKPIFSTTFDDLITERVAKVDEIVQVLNLNPEQRQVQNAVNFLDKDKKHY